MKTLAKTHHAAFAFGALLMATLCPEGQELLYHEDFEDGNAWGWYNIEDTEFSYEEIEGRGIVLSMRRMPDDFADVFYLDEFANAVWFIDVQAGVTHVPRHAARL